MRATGPAPAHILVVDDEPSITELLATALRYMGYQVTVADSGFAALDAAATSAPDLVVLDVMLPDLDGFEVCRRLRDARDFVPVIFLSARDSEDDRVTGFVRGGDDYVTKPFSLEELTLRISALLRRVGKGADGDANPRLRYRDLEMDEDRHQVWRAGREVAALPDRVPAAPLLPAQPGARAVQAADPRSRLAVRLQRRGQRRRDVRRVPAPQARRHRAAACSGPSAASATSCEPTTAERPRRPTTRDEPPDPSPRNARGHARRGARPRRRPDRRAHPRQPDRAGRPGAADDRWRQPRTSTGSPRSPTPTRMPAAGSPCCGSTGTATSSGPSRPASQATPIRSPRCPPIPAGSLTRVRGDCPAAVGRRLDVVPGAARAGTARPGVVAVAAPMTSVEAAERALLRGDADRGRTGDGRAAAGRLGRDPAGLLGRWSGCRTAEEIAAGDLSHRAGVPHDGTEVGRLGTAFDSMLDQIEGSFAEQRAALEAKERSEARLRRFVADASHELRTPLTTVRGYADLYRAGGLDDAEALATAMDRIGTESRRMSTLVEDLLLLARLDRGRRSAGTPWTWPDRRRRRARPAGHRAWAPGGLVIVPWDHRVGDDDRLRQVVGNLVANVRVHAGPGTPVESSSQRSMARRRCASWTTARASTRRMPTRCFDRFYRADRAVARSRRDRPGPLDRRLAVGGARRPPVARDDAGGGATFVVSAAAHRRFTAGTRRPFSHGAHADGHQHRPSSTDAPLPGGNA